MPVSLIIALITQVGLPLALQLIEMYQKDPATVITPEMWATLKTQIQKPFDQLAGPK